jgi:TolA-binding protein
MSSHFKSLLNLFVIASTGLIVYACSSVKEASDFAGESNDFFDPSTTVVQTQSDRPAKKNVAARPTVETKDFSSNGVMESAYEQRRRLKNLLHQLESADPRFALGVNAIHRLQQSLDDDHDGRACSSDQQTIELLREQNARLIDVLDQLKTVVIQQDVALRQSFAGLRNDTEKNQPKTPSAIDARQAYGRAIRLYEEHRYGDAIVAFQRLLQSTEDDDITDNCRFWMGVSYFNLHRYKEAIPQFSHLLAHQWFEKREDTYIMLGQCYEQQGERSLAKATYETLVQLNPVCDLAYVAHLKISML